MHRNNVCVFHLVYEYVFEACIQGGEQKLVLLKLVLQVGERKLRVTDALQQGDKGREEMTEQKGKKKEVGWSGNRTRDLSHPKRESCL